MVITVLIAHPHPLTAAASAAFPQNPEENRY